MYRRARGTDFQDLTICLNFSQGGVRLKTGRSQRQGYLLEDGVPRIRERRRLGLPRRRWAPRSRHERRRTSAKTPLSQGLWQPAARTTQPILPAVCRPGIVDPRGILAAAPRRSRGASERTIIAWAGRSPLPHRPPRAAVARACERPRHRTLGKVGKVQNPRFKTQVPPVRCSRPAAQSCPFGDWELNFGPCPHLTPACCTNCPPLYTCGVGMLRCRSLPRPNVGGPKRSG